MLRDILCSMTGRCYPAITLSVPRCYLTCDVTARIHPTLLVPSREALPTSTERRLLLANQLAQISYETH